MIIKVLLIVLIILAALIILAWAGFQVPPPYFSPFPEKTKQLGYVGLPADLPPPVRRHFKKTVGDRVPRIESAAIWGTGKLKIAGLWTPIRFQAFYRPGHDFYRYMESTWLRFPIFRGSDSYINGEGLLNITGLVSMKSSGEKISEAQNQALWGETLFAPSAFLTDSRIRWEPVDKKSAWLVVPFGAKEEKLKAVFDPQTGLMASVSALRYRGQEEERTPWRGDFYDWQPFHSVLLPRFSTASWEDEKSPYVMMHIDGVEYNVDVSKWLPEPKE
jgi:hypothetical protein